MKKISSYDLIITYSSVSMRPFLWSSGQSFWLQSQWVVVVGLEPGPLSLVGTTEELLERKSIGSGLENREYDRRDPSR
jgi:hypothetical protein